MKQSKIEIVAPTALQSWLSKFEIVTCKPDATVYYRVYFSKFYVVCSLSLRKNLEKIFKTIAV